MSNPVSETVDVDKPIRCPAFRPDAPDDRCKGCECAPLCMEKRGIIEVEP